MKDKLLKIIKNSRKSQGLSQKQVAEKLGISAPAYSNLESGKFEITLKRLDEILVALGIEDEEVMQGNYTDTEALREILALETELHQRLVDLLPSNEDTENQ